MNNEEKILAMLEQLQQGQAKTNERLGALEASQHRLEFLMEHTIPTQINQLAEGHMGLNERLPDADEIESLKARVCALENVVAEHLKAI